MKILAIATVTVREALSRKVQVNLLIFGAVLLAASFVASWLTLGYSHRIIADLGLSGMEFVGVLLAVFLGADLVAGDVQRRIIYPIVAKPVSRLQYVIGRYAGLASALLVNLLAMTAMLSTLLALDAGSLAPLDRSLAGAVALLAVKVLTVAAVAVLFSCFTNTTLAAIFALTLTIAGYLATEARALWQGDNAWVATLVWYLVPDLGRLTVNDAVIYRTALPASIGLAAIHAALYAATALTVGALVLERRDFR
jgi:ABC-type transport system involved in multi-copper enzyme maturation permease subunit